MDRFVRKTKGDRPVVAICYDFDKTLSPDNMQAQGYLQAINYENQNEFWAETNEIAQAQDRIRMFRAKNCAPFFIGFPAQFKMRFQLIDSAVLISQIIQC